MSAALDLFCGAAGGWSLGLHRAGVRTIAACEIDVWRRQTFACRWPDARIYADVRELTADRLLADLGRLPDWIVGSPPCQDASCANAGGRGVDGDRTGLFFEAVRLVGECRPAWACFENVPGLRTRGADRMLAALEALGYACWPLVVGAVHAGAPHRRQRVWIVAADLSRFAGGLYEVRDDQESAPHLGRHRPGQNAADANGDGLRQQSRRGERSDWQGQTEPAADHQRRRPADAAQPNAAADAAGMRSEGLAWAGGQQWAEASPVLDAGKRQAGGLLDFDDSDTHGAGLAQWQSVGGDALEELPTAIRAVAEGSGWNGGALGLARSRRVADGLSAGMASKCISAYGDAVLPQITEAIARSIISVSPPSHHAAAEAWPGRSAPAVPPCS